MEVIALLTLATLALLVWKTLEVNDKAEQINARLNNMDTVIAEYYKMLKNLQPKGEVEIPVRLDTEVLKEVIPGLYKDEEKLKKWRDTSTYAVHKPEEGDIKFGEIWEKDEYPEPNEALQKGADEYKKKIMDEDDTQYGNEGSTFSLYEDEQLKKIRKHVREQKKKSLNK